MPRNDWPTILDTSKAIMESYDTGVTLRQLFYRLVSAGILSNTQSNYSQLSSRTAEARRAGWFPGFIDRSRSIYRYLAFSDPLEARDYLCRVYRRDRTEGQEFNVYIGVEKAGMVSQLQLWFGDYGVPIIALSGYSSQSYVDEIREDVIDDGRPAVLIYAGDFDPSGIDISRDFNERADCFDRYHRIALNEEQVTEYRLPPQPGKASDTRAQGFIDRFGKLVQVELDALPPDAVRSLYSEALAEYFDVDQYNAVVQQERAERESLAAGGTP